VHLELASPGLPLLTAAAEPPGADDPDAHRPGEFWDEVEGRWLPLPPFGRWLGHWRHEYEGMDHLALVMRVSRPAERAAAERGCAHVQGARALVRSPARSSASVLVTARSACY
jgi:hypothetical protein